MSKDDFLYTWLSGPENRNNFFNQFPNSLNSKNTKKLLASHHLAGNFFHYRSAIKILGMEYKEVFEDGRLDLNPDKWADFAPLNFHIGPPENVVNCLKKNTNSRNINFYPPNLILSLKRIAAESIFAKDCGRSFNIIGVEGAQAGMAYSIMAFVNPREEVIITDPGYFFLEPPVIMSGARIKRVKLSKKNNYRIDIESLRSKITRRTKMIIVCDPINPFGTIQTKEELKEIISIANRNNIIVVNNITHCFHQLNPEAKHYPMSALRGVDLRNVISVSGVSHGFGLAGLRVGFIAGNPRLLDSILAIKSAVTRININVLAQYAALEALKDRSYLKNCEAVLRGNFLLLKNIINGAFPLKIIIEPDYGFFACIDTSKIKASAQELTVALFKRRCAIYPSDGLGDNSPTSYIRINFSSTHNKHFKWLREALPAAIKEAESGIYRTEVINFFKSVGSARAKKIIKIISRI